jgi:hypothetical protein
MSMSRILTSLHGRLVGLSREGTVGAMKGKKRLLCEGGFGAGPEGLAIPLPGPSYVALFDDFLGDVLADQWNAVETDTDGAQAVLAGGIGGVLRITTGNDDGNAVVLPDLSGVTSYLNWQASNGGLFMQARIKISRITLAYIFVGFTDLITIEAPVYAAGSADTITTDATDAVGFMFDTGMATDTFHLVGVATNTDATIQTLTTAPVADDYITLRVEVSEAGVATFYINGRQAGTAMSGAVTAAADLTPVVYASNTDGTSAVTLDVDYIAVGMNRAADGDAT